MNGPDRYRTLEGMAGEAAEGASRGYLEGVDPVTGLPVLIYDFPGDPLTSTDGLDSENIPRILWSGREGDQGRIVAALSPGWQRLDEGSGPLTTDRLLGAARALRDAAAAGVAHGDLTPQRLLVVQGRLQLEGFGVPWVPRATPYRAPEVSDEATPEGDVYSLARIVEVLGLTAGDETVTAILEQCTAENPLERPSAEELYLALEALAMHSTSVDGGSPAGGVPTRTDGPKSASEQRSTEPGPTSDAAGPPASPEHHSRPRERTPEAVAGRGSAATSTPGPSSEPRPSGALGTTTDGNGGVGSAVPPPPPEEPGGERRELRLRLTLLGALMAAVVILALLALYGPRAQPSPPRPLEDVVYVVEVEVVPNDLPPVAIHVIEAPEGSSYGRSDVIGTAPRHLALDRAGTWAFQGSLDGRRSEVVAIEVPEERTVTLVMPDAGQP